MTAVVFAVEMERMGGFGDVTVGRFVVCLLLFVGLAFTQLTGGDGTMLHACTSCTVITLEVRPTAYR